MSEATLTTVAVVAYLVLCLWVGLMLQRQNRALRRDRKKLLSAVEALDRWKADGPDVVDLRDYQARRSADPRLYSVIT